MFIDTDSYVDGSCDKAVITQIISIMINHIHGDGFAVSSEDKHGDGCRGDLNPAGLHGDAAGSLSNGPGHVSLICYFAVNFFAGKASGIFIQQLVMQNIHKVGKQGLD